MPLYGASQNQQPLIKSNKTVNPATKQNILKQAKLMGIKDASLKYTNRGWSVDGKATSTTQYQKFQQMAGSMIDPDAKISPFKVVALAQSSPPIGGKAPVINPPKPNITSPQVPVNNPDINIPQQMINPPVGQPQTTMSPTQIPDQVEVNTDFSNSPHNQLGVSTVRGTGAATTEISATAPDRLGNLGQQERQNPNKTLEQIAERINSRNEAMQAMADDNITDQTATAEPVGIDLTEMINQPANQSADDSVIESTEEIDAGELNTASDSVDNGDTVNG